MLEVFRKEFKYSVSTVGFYKARPVLETALRLDEHCGDGMGYAVRSLYFDSAGDDDLFDVLDGLNSKQKVRLRCYSPSAELMKLEYKCKTGTDSQKKSLTVSRRDAKRMAAGRYDFLLEMRDATALELFGRLKSGAYQPRVVVEYRRVAYTAPQNDVRVTFDSNVAATQDVMAFFDERPALVPVSAEGSGVLEVKYNSFLPAYIKSALEIMNVSPVANSKYAQSRLIF